MEYKGDKKYKIYGNFEEVKIERWRGNNADSI